MNTYSFLKENNQTITHSKKSARQLAYRYRNRGDKIKDNNLGIYHIYRTHIDDEGNKKIKRIKKKLEISEE